MNGRNKLYYDEATNCIVDRNGGLAYEEVIDGELITTPAAARRLAELENQGTGKDFEQLMDILAGEGLIDAEKWAGWWK